MDDHLMCIARSLRDPDRNRRPGAIRQIAVCYGQFLVLAFDQAHAKPSWIAFVGWDWSVTGFAALTCSSSPSRAPRSEGKGDFAIAPLNLGQFISHLFFLYARCQPSG